ncbi:MAG TPA: hypothetical protein VMS08_05135 [Candidatus Saccharimonadia bacterium]|nr:hypothetical protein [Candidatus Saccharimonadia bacterium]
MSSVTNKPSYEELEAEVARLRGQSPEAKPTVKSRRRWRSVGVGLLILVGCIGLVSADAGLWANRTLVRQDGYVRTVGPLVRQPAVQVALVSEVQTAVTSHVDIRAVVRSVLPPRAAFLAVPLTGQVTNGIHQALTHIVSSEGFSNLWVQVNTRAHARLVHAIQTYQGNGQINVTDAYRYLGAKLQQTPLAAVAKTALPSKLGNIVIINASWLPVAHRSLVALAWSVPVGLGVAILSLAGAIWLSDRKRRTLALFAVWSAFSMCLLIVAVRVARDATLSQFHVSLNRDAGMAIWQAMLAPLFEQTAVWVAVAIIVGAVAWYTGLSVSAVRWRVRLSGGVVGLYRATGSLGAGTPAIAWLGRRRRALEWGIAVLIVIVLMFMTPLSLAILGWAAVILLASVMLVEFLSSASRAGVGAGLVKH